MRNRIVPLSCINQSQNNQQSVIPLQSIVNREAQQISNENQNNISNQNINDVSSLQQLNMFLEKMDLEKGQEEDEKENGEEPKQIREQEKVVEQQNLNCRQPQIVIEPAQSDQRNVKLCKICLEDTNELNNLLITPCKCQGSVGNIHQECLKTWIVSQGYDLLSPIKCELCNEEYEMEIEVSSKFIPVKACQDTKCIQLVSFFWLVIFMIGNVAAIVVLLYYQVINQNSQWGYIIMAVAILVLFEVALVLLVKHQTQEIFFGLYIKNWQILSICQAVDQIQNDNNNNEQINKDNQKSDGTGGQFFNNNISRNQHQIRIIESRSVLSNQNQEIYNQNIYKIPSRQSQSRNSNQQEIPKAQNYSLGVNNEMRFSNSNQQSLQKKSMTISQMKAHLGLDDEDEEEEEKKENRIDKEISDKKINENDERILNFIKNNKDLYNHIIQSYIRMDNQFILKNNEISKEITVQIPMESYQNTQNTYNNGVNHKQSANQFINLQNIQQEKILIYDKNNINIHQSNKVSQNNNDNLRSQSAQQQQKYNNQNLVQSKSHHLIDIFQQENILNQQTEDKNIKVDIRYFNSSKEQNTINEKSQMIS
ncbi:hypothetical protein ABPG74_014504 [Tetrahymena malaccensis]